MYESYCFTYRDFNGNTIIDKGKNRLNAKMLHVKMFQLLLEF